MGRIIIVDIKADILDIKKDIINNTPEIINNKKDDDIKGNIYEKMLKISINNIAPSLPIRREAVWFD